MEKRRLKIGMFLDTSFPPDSRVENEAYSLIKAGYEVHLFSLCFNKLPPFETINGIKVHRYHGNKLIYKFSALAYTFPFYHWAIKEKIQHFIKINGIDVLHVHDMVIAQAVFDLNQKIKLPLVLDLHENRPEIMQFYRHVNTINGKILINLDGGEESNRSLSVKLIR